MGTQSNIKIIPGSTFIKINTQNFVFVTSLGQELKLQRGDILFVVGAKFKKLNEDYRGSCTVNAGDSWEHVYIDFLFEGRKHQLYIDRSAFNHRLMNTKTLELFYVGE